MNRDHAAAVPQSIAIWPNEPEWVRFVGRGFSRDKNISLRLGALAPEAPRRITYSGICKGVPRSSFTRAVESLSISLADTVRRPPSGVM